MVYVIPKCFQELVAVHDTVVCFVDYEKKFTFGPKTVFWFIRKKSTKNLPNSSKVVSFYSSSGFLWISLENNLMFT